MTDQEEKLVELLKEIGMLEIEDCLYTAEYLISHGVTVREMQKPLTVEELQKDTVCWYEEHNDNIVPVAIGRCTSFIEVYFIGCDVPIEEKKWEYGKTWRCWAEKPTEEERKAAEWET